MMLGDLLARFGDESAATEAVLNIGDLRLVAALRKCAEAEGLELGTFAALAVRRYEAEAPAAEWVTLMGELRGSTDPGLAFIKRAFAHATRAVL